MKSVILSIPFGLFAAAAAFGQTTGTTHTQAGITQSLRLLGIAGADTTGLTTPELSRLYFILEDESLGAGGRRFAARSYLARSAR